MMPGIPYYLPPSIAEDMDVVVKRITHPRKLDAPILITGNVGSGKTTLAIQIAYYIAQRAAIPYTMDQIVFNPQQLLDVLMDKKGDKPMVVHYDESNTGLSGKYAMSKEGKQTEMLLDLCRSKRAALIMCTPKFRGISESIVEERVLNMYHCQYKNGRNQVYGLDRENMIRLYHLIKNKKDLGDVITTESKNFTGWPFRNNLKDAPFTEEEYEDKKALSIAAFFNNKHGADKKPIDYEKLSKVLSGSGLDTTEIAKIINKSETQVRRYLGRA